MKKQIFTTVILYLIIGISVVHAQMPLKRVNELQTEANGLYDKKEYAKAVKLYQKAFAEYSAHHECQSSIDCGLKAADLYIQLGTYKEAYDIFREINQVIRNAASRTKNPQYANYFALAKERFLLNLKLKNQSQASAQLERMADAAKGLKSTEANNDRLYMQTAFDYTFGNNNAGCESRQKLITG